jgi:DNA-binding transcriptional LysR family regulator
MLDYRYIKAFMVTVKHLNFTKAAEDLGVAQSAVSRQIKLLEESLGEELFIRGTKKILLTSKGHDLYSLVAQFEKSQKTLFEKNHFPHIRVGVLHGLLENWLIPLLPKYLKDAQCIPDFAVRGPEELEHMLISGELDLMISTHFIQTEILSSLRLFTEKLILVSRQPIKRTEVTKQRWLVYGPDDAIFKLGQAGEEGTLEVNSLTAILSLVEKGVGIAALPDHAAMRGKNLHTLSVNELGKNEVYLTGMNYQNPPPAIRHFTQFLKENIPV